LFAKRIGETDLLKCYILAKTNVMLHSQVYSAQRPNCRPIMIEISEFCCQQLKFDLST